MCKLPKSSDADRQRDFICLTDSLCLRTAQLLLFHGQSGFLRFTKSHIERRAVPKRTDREQQQTQKKESLLKNIED